ncbi:MAG: dihydroorotase [Clostridiales Family XIII bacterium]|jgi:dihydroorotase|nr:dihydroorotase [Clostridiales Family XIII bacterium]
MAEMVLENIMLIDGSGRGPCAASICCADGVVKKIERKTGAAIAESGIIAVPGFVDVHVHFRDPGFTEKEDIASGSEAAAAGGFTTVCCMPNTNPALHSPEILADIDRRARETGRVNLFALSAMTVGQAGRELANFAAMDRTPTLCRELTGHGICGITEDGKSLLNEDMMRQVLIAAKRLGLVVMDHAEPETEITERDIRLARETGAHIHIQHVSAAATVDLVRAAKKTMPNITCETAPHYFTLTSEALDRLGPLAKMNPPLRTERDREAIREGLADGTIDVIATDHAPHTLAEKSRPVDEAPFGIIGLETCFALAYTHLVKTGVLTLPQLIEKMSAAPARLIGLDRGIITEGKAADITLIDTAYEGVIDSSAFRSKGRNTPFDGMPVSGRVIKTLRAGAATFEVKENA